MRASAELWTAGIAAAADAHTLGARGMPSPLLMERAALAVSHEVAALRQGSGRPVLVLCGPGNNGGDGLAVARQLFGWQIPARAVLCTPGGNAAFEYQRGLCERQGVSVSAAWPTGIGAPIVVDALLGTGSQGAPRGPIAQALARLARIDGPRVSVDIPTGVDPDTGTVHPDAVQAGCTVTFARSKVGLHVGPGRDAAGRVVVADIGVIGEPDRARHFGLVDPGFVARILGTIPGLTQHDPAPPAHKGQRGHLGIVGGSAGTPGAAVLAAAGALRGGTGLVTIASSDPAIQRDLLAYRPEVMLATRDDTALLPEARALCIGPGLREVGGIAALWRDEPRPAVYDAGALDHIPLATGAAGPRVLTPHPGEAARLLGRAEPDAGWDAAQVQRQRLVAVRRLVEHTGAVVVLKGVGTLVGSPSRDGVVTHVVLSGSSALATAGSGDVLAGLLGGLLARGVTAPVAACVGAFVHGLAGERLAVGAVAMDVADALGPAAAHVQSPTGRDHPAWPQHRYG